MRLHDGRRPGWPAVLARPLAWMLVLAMLLIVPQLPFPLLDQYDIGKVALRLAVIMYCCEFLIARRGSRRLVALNLASIFGVLTLAFNQF